MKTIEEASCEYSKKTGGDNFTKIQLELAFEACAEFLQRWIPVEEELPPLGVYVLCKDFANYDVYWFDSNNDRMNKLHEYTITHWRPIELK